MKRTTIMLPEELEQRLRYEARRRGVSLADLAREAIAHYLPEPPPRRSLAFFATGEADVDDVSEHVDEAVSRAVRRRARADAAGP